MSRVMTDVLRAVKKSAENPGSKERFPVLVEQRRGLD